jgi:tRNA-Thr(GGU) m(6)t(6)A37 methyltransferase TsaA
MHNEQLESCAALPPMTAIGVIHTPFANAEGSPIQSRYAAGAEGTAVLLPEFEPALRNLEGFERVWLLYLLDRASTPKLVVCPYLDTLEHGIFATRAPARPNPIGLSAVRLLGIDGLKLRFADVDMLDGTPLLDIKPYVPEFDSFPASRAGWYEGRLRPDVVADGRFEKRDN